MAFCIWLGEVDEIVPRSCIAACRAALSPAPDGMASAASGASRSRWASHDHYIGTDVSYVEALPLGSPLRRIGRTPMTLFVREPTMNVIVCGTYRFPVIDARGGLVEAERFARAMEWPWVGEPDDRYVEGLLGYGITERLPLFNWELVVALRRLLASPSWTEVVAL